MSDEKTEKKLVYNLTDLPGVGSATAQKLIDAGYSSIEAIAVATPQELSEITGLPIPTASKIIKAARELLGFRFKTALELKKERMNVQKITTGSRNLDELLGGGIETRNITEFFGEFGSGKCFSKEMRVYLQEEDKLFLDNIEHIYNKFKNIEGELPFDEGYIVPLRNAYVYSFDPNVRRLIKTRPTFIYKEKVSKILNVKLSNGITLGITKIHPVLKVKKERLFWKPAYSLEEGDTIVVLRDDPENITSDRELLEETEVLDVYEKEYDDWVYDLVVPATRNFIGERGSILHNTQLCHQLSVNVQLPKDKGGLEAKAVYIDSEGTFRWERIEAMAKGVGLDPDEVMENIYWIRAVNSHHQMAIVEELFDLLKRENVKLVVIDSITSHFRAEFPGRENLAMRQQLLNKHLHQLMRLAEIFDVAVVITNQVMSRPDVFYGDPTQAVGGHVLYHAPGVRVQLKKSRGNKRIARVVDAPHIPEGETIFVITEWGIRDPE